MRPSASARALQLGLMFTHTCRRLLARTARYVWKIGENLEKIVWDDVSCPKEVVSVGVMYPPDVLTPRSKGFLANSLKSTAIVFYLPLINFLFKGNSPLDTLSKGILDGKQWCTDIDFWYYFCSVQMGSPILRLDSSWVDVIVFVLHLTGL